MNYSGPNRKLRSGFTLVEAVCSTLLVAVLLVAALRTAAASIALQSSTAQRSRARLLADDLMAEILTQAYEQPGGGAVFGPESGQSSGLSRALFDDVDDYANYTETLLQQKDGTLLPDTQPWQRRVTVQWVVPADLNQSSAAETGVKCIIVECRFNNIVLATRTALKVRA